MKKNHAHEIRKTENAEIKATSCLKPEIFY